MDTPSQSYAWNGFVPSDTAIGRAMMRGPRVHAQTPPQPLTHPLPPPLRVKQQLVTVNQ